MKLMIILLISLLLATSVEAGKKKCTKCTNKFEAAKKKFNKCERKNCPSPPPASPPAPPLLRGSVCLAPPAVGTCGTALYPDPSGLECKCFTILVRDVPEEICTCEPKSPYLDTVCLAPPAVGACGGGIQPPPGQDPSGLTCQCEVFGPKETCTCRPERPEP
tara:strand:+ start:157 stop:642 length:486 start_codon:yes stop_codon:yes gene_type:complete